MPVFALGKIAPDLPPADRHFLAYDADVIGRVRIGIDVGIWFGAVLRGDQELIDVGDGSNVQDLCMLHTDAGFPLTIGRNCTIGDGSLIGMGATVLTGARIGANCLVGANALVTQNADFPDGSLILGTPAKRVRGLSPEEIEEIGRSAAHYVQNGKRFSEEFAPVS